MPEVVEDFGTQVDQRLDGRMGGSSITSVAPTQRRRRPLIALGALMVVISALVAAWLVASASETHRVVIANGDLQPGRAIGQGDLLVVDIAGGLETSSISADQQARIVGRFPIGPIPSGTLLNDSMFIDRESVIPPGRVIVGAVLEPGRLPVDSVSTGDRVELIDTGDGDKDRKVASIGVGTVFFINAIDNGYWVAVEVDSDDRLAVAGAAARGDLALGMVG